MAALASTSVRPEGLVLDDAMTGKARSTASGKSPTASVVAAACRAGAATPYDCDSEEEGAAGGVSATMINTAAKAGRKILDPIAGIPVYGPEEQILIGRWRAVIAANFERFGFSSFTPDPVVSTAALGLKGGLSHEMYGVYRISTSDGAGFGLPFDRTVPMALYVARHFNEIPYPWARYDINNSWRAESPAPGRFRGFEQCDVDFINRGKSITPEQEADCLGAIIRSLQEIGVPPFVICINHLAIAKALFANLGVPADKMAEVLHILDKIEKVGIDATCAEIIATVPGIDPTALAIVVTRLNTPARVDGSDFADIGGEEVTAAFDHLSKLVGFLALQGVDVSRIQVRPSMVRGLDYYTGFTFETYFEGEGRKFGSIASGGAYDNLVGSFNKAAKDVCGCGGSIGLTRLFHVMKEIHALDGILRKVTHDISVILQDDSMLRAHAAVTGKLRAIGYRVFQMTTSEGDLKKQISKVNKSGSPWCVIVKSDGKYVLKNMVSASGEQTEHESPDSLAAHIGTLGLRKV